MVELTTGGPRTLGGAVSVPPQVFEVTVPAPGAIRRSSGKTSVKLSPDKGTGALLVIVKTRTTLVPRAALLGLKILVNPGGATWFTVKLTGAL